MSMSTHVVGFAPPDEKWQKMKAVWDACAAAKIPVPDEVDRFFNFNVPDSSGVEIELENLECVSEYRAEMVDGFQIDLSKLPPNVKFIRFFNSY